MLFLQEKLQAENSSFVGAVVYQVSKSVPAIGCRVSPAPVQQADGYRQR